MGPAAVWVVEDDVVTFRKVIFEFFQNCFDSVGHCAEMDWYVLCLGY